jgi:DNA-binding PucR family transcriptional regulator
MQYDAMYRTSYTSTLRCYLDMGRNAPAAAEKLNIHRNTLDYRLKKIEELQNIQLQNTEDMFSMVYSLYILTYLGTAF